MVIVVEETVEGQVDGVSEHDDGLKVVDCNLVICVVDSIRSKVRVRKPCAIRSNCCGSIDARGWR